MLLDRPNCFFSIGLFTHLSLEIFRERKGRNSLVGSNKRKLSQQFFFIFLDLIQFFKLKMRLQTHF